MIDPLIAISVFLVTGLMDALHAVYTKAVSDAKPALAATSGSVIYLISAYAVIQYTQNLWYLLFMVTGSWFGTYLTIKYKK
jgi:UDP-N-acetylmuramyl pentapeptide phosphotransferase/UDP-N-acetylglucosamine-1-phosphate transferase